MGEISRYIGEKIRNFRKLQGMTLQKLADSIHKSRASVSKYENGEITIDIETLYDISDALQVDINELLDYRTKKVQTETIVQDSVGESPYFQANRLYFYFYDGRYHRLKDGVIDIHKKEDGQGNYEATLSISAMTATGRSSKTYYSGKVVYSDMLIRFSFVNQYNKLEEDLLYIFNPLEPRDFTEGLLCGISSADLMPCAFKCLVTLTAQESTEELMQHLLITNQELKRWQKLNMMVVDNRQNVR